MSGSSSCASSLLSSDIQPEGNSSKLHSSPHTHFPVGKHVGQQGADIQYMQASGGSKQNEEAETHTEHIFNYKGIK